MEDALHAFLDAERADWPHALRYVAECVGNVMVADAGCAPAQPFVRELVDACRYAANARDGSSPELGALQRRAKQRARESHRTWSAICTSCCASARR